ncbi:glycosyltransferase [Flavihumibacter sp. CACIAM 22H1]|uniref:glycosyltransferase n=1 Tax=Flavihumibacter sp. CACIAM 22H1 TaxID=1812911 RepID=UPI0007A85DE4|nr:glycosyltransferase [Flavihumibacter sp. CACIAM 22H1]KYP15145.1 MAG: hypothetical protein A1D16_12635 [Flavihumibacter sp. CACIAM 22H1]
MLVQPLVSIIIPCYNSIEFVPDAIDAVLSTDYKNIEIIVVDDGSVEPVQPFLAEKYPECNALNCIRQPNKGLAGARNTGILQAKGDYLVFLDADDLIYPTKLSRQIDYFRNNPTVTVVYSLSEWFVGKDLQQRMPVNFPVYEGLILPNLLNGNFIHVNSAMVKRAAVLEAGLFDEQLRELEDWDLWLRLACRGGSFACIREVLSSVRLHYGSMTSNQAKMNKTMVRVLEKIRPELQFHFEKQQDLIPVYYTAYGNFILQARLNNKFWPAIKMAYNACGLRFLYPGCKLIIKYFRSFFFTPGNKTTEELEHVWNRDKKGG